MAELLIDSTRLVVRLLKRRLPTGVDRVCLAYVRQYAATARAVLQRGHFGVILPQSLSRQLFATLLEPDQQIVRRTVGVLLRSICQARAPPCPGSILLNVGHSGLEQPHYAAWLRRRQLRPIYMVHDLIPVTHPEYCRPRERERHERRMETVLHTASAVVTNSRVTLQALGAYAAGRGITMPPALAAPLAGAALQAGRSSRPLPEPYFVMLSTIEPRKNHWTILQVWRRLIERLGAQAPRLVVIGQRGWECQNVVELLDRCPVLRGFVIQKSDCSDVELGSYLGHAQALLFPSFVEGFGLPLIEALSLGVPAIASDLSVFREIAGDIPDYLDPLDATGWMNGIDSYRDSRSRARTTQLQRLTKFKAPTWLAHFEQFEQLLGQVC